MLILNINMKELLLKHLDRNYYMTFSSYMNYKFILKANNDSVRLNVVVDELKIIFGLPHDELVDIVLIWVEKESIIINNEIVEELENGAKINLAEGTIQFGEK
jgi:hypothetical protein